MPITANSVQYGPWQKGVRYDLPTEDLGAEALFSMSNCRVGQAGQVEKRKGFAKFNSSALNSDATVTAVGQVTLAATEKTFAIAGDKFYDVTGGRITLDGIDVRDATLDSLRDNVGIAMQDVFLFSATIADNISYGKPGTTQKEVERAARIAQLHEFVVELPDGYNTWVGERGITLSGGQRQRLAIARTVLLDPPILVLDDSTSSIDAGTEHLLREALESVMHGRTTFVIAHRLSTVMHADQIIVLDMGTIAEQGTHRELVQKNGLYRQLYELQLLPAEPTIDGLASSNQNSDVSS